MKPLIPLLLLGGLLMLNIGTQAAPGVESAATRWAGGKSVVVGLSPFLDRGVKDDIYRRLVSLLVQDLPGGASLSIYDAYHLKTVLTVEIPTARPFQNERTRVNQFQQSIRQLRDFLAATSVTAGAEKTPNPDAIRLPEFLDFVMENVRVSPPTSPAILILGSPLHIDPREPASSMRDGYVPTDGHLLAAREKTPYGLRDKTNASPGMVVLWGYFGNPWINELHRESIERFWSLYFQVRGGRLGSFSSDLATVFTGLRRSPADLPPPSDALDADSKRIAMVRLNRRLDPTDWITRDTVSGVTEEPPTSFVGPMKIGIRWRGAIDLDLYARPKRTGETLFFEHPRSPEGFFDKDHRVSPDHDFEYVEFESPVDIREVEAAVNFYAGTVSAPVSGEVRVEFGGRIYSGAFTISALHGNEGRSGAGQREHWTTLNLSHLLRLSP